MPERCVGRLAVRSAAALIMCVGIAAGSAGAQGIRCVVMTGQQAAQAPAGAVFASIEPATISAGAGVVFRGTLAQGAGGVTGGNDTGIWRYALGKGGKGSSQLLAREGSAAQAIAGATIAELGQPTGDPASPMVTYWTRITGAGITPGVNDRAILSATGTSHSLWYQSGSAFYGTTEGMITSLDDYRDHPVLNAPGSPAFTGLLESGLTGVFSNDANGDAFVVALQGQPVVDLPGGTVYASRFSSPVRDNLGDIAYKASLQHGVGDADATNDEVIMIRMMADGAYFWVARRGGIIGHGNETTFETLSDPIVTDEPRVGFKAGFRHGIFGVSASNDAALCSLCPCGSIQLNVQEGEVVSGMPAGAVFEDFSLPLFSRDSRLLFGARLRGEGVSASNDTSIWWAEIPFGFVMVAREGAAAPGAGSATFADFNIDSPAFWIGTSEGNQLVFSAQLSTGARGLWVFTPYRGVRPLVIEGQSVEVAAGDVRQIVSLTPNTEGYWSQGRRTAISSDGHVAFSATVTGGQSGVFVADLPPTTMGCPSDWDNSTVVNSQDFFSFLTDFFASTADINNSGATDSQDFFDFLGAFFAGC